MRSTYTTSASLRLARSYSTLTPISSMPRGMSVGGATSVTSMPIMRNPMTSLRATRLCRMSPTMKTLQALEVAPQALPQREEVEQALRGVLVLAVAGVDHAGPGVGRDQLARPGRRVPHDDDVGRVGAQGDGRVFERLALLDVDAGARGRAAEDQGVGREPLGREVVARRGARRGLPEQVDDGAPAEGRDLLDVSLEHREEALRGVQQQLDVAAREVLHADQVAFGHGQLSLRTRTTSSTPSHSSTRTEMRSWRAVGRFLPT